MKFTNSHKILIVEDDDSIRNLYALKLRQQGFIAETADNGLTGLRAAKKMCPDLILLDLRMPIMDGEEMLSILRTSEWGSSIRVVILTNISKNEAPHALRFLHVDRYIVKVHNTPSQVVAIVREVLC